MADTSAKMEKEPSQVPLPVASVSKTSKEGGSTSKMSLGRVVDDEDMDYHEPIKWVNIIFLPFHPLFKAIATIAAFIKLTLGPLRAVAPYIICDEKTIWPWNLQIIKFCYMHLVDIFYGIDTVLYVLHRQITDVAVKREFASKPGIFLALDLISLVPFFQLASSESCPKGTLWPNILAFNELLLTYRVVQYFEIKTTFQVFRRFCGFAFVFMICAHCVTCLLVLLTIQGLCPNCNNRLNYRYDWRRVTQFNLTDGIDLYIEAFPFAYGIFFMEQPVDALPETYTEFFFTMIFMILGHILLYCFFQPLQFMHSIESICVVSDFHKRTSRIFEETKLRNKSQESCKSVKHFYDHIWKKRSGMVSLPAMESIVPKYMRVEIKLDLEWAIFYHSPTLRYTSTPFKRFISELVRQEFKLPGQRFFAGPHCFSNVYYIKSGIVQFISHDDSVSPILSVSDGTIFGDISFYIPPIKRKAIVRCLNYCEVLVISRSNFLKALHIFPEDRRLIIEKAKMRIKHAHDLYECKVNYRGKDRVTDEGLAWLKRRWWEITNTIQEWKSTKKTDDSKCQLSAEEVPYHCAKYIGQLVLCDESQLQQNNMFAKVEFPFILQSNSQFSEVWQQIVTITVYLVILLYPPNLNKPAEVWFQVFKFGVDFIFILDVCILLITIENKELTNISLKAVMLARCKTPRFFLDLLSSKIIENMLVLLRMEKYIQVSQFSRLIKAHVLFQRKWKLNFDENPLMTMMLKILLLTVTYYYVVAYIFYAINRFVPEMESDLFFSLYCDAADADTCDKNIMYVFLGFWNDAESEAPMYSSYLNKGLKVLFSFVTFLLEYYIDILLLAVIYLRLKESISYNFFVTDIKQHYLKVKIHPDLLKRIDRYLQCHWKHYHGMDIMYPSLLLDEPYDIYWKFHGCLAEQTIADSKFFDGADMSMIRELAHKAKFLILPNFSALTVFGVQTKNIMWVVKGSVRCEYHSEDGKLIKEVFQNFRELMAVLPVLFGKAALRTYTAVTDVEVLYLEKNQFITILKRYPHEWAYIQNCCSELKSQFDSSFYKYVKKHKLFQQNVRDQISQSVKTSEDKDMSELSINGLTFFNDPESRFMRFWIIFRAIIVFCSITVAGLQFGRGARIKKYLSKIVDLYDGVAIVDISIKFFVGYYDKNGVIISDTRKCVVNYLSRGFLLDMMGVMPMAEILSTLQEDDTKSDVMLNMLADIMFNACHLYIIWECFNYYCDTPRSNIIFMSIIKWVTLLLLVIILYMAHLMYLAVDITWDEHDQFVRYIFHNESWLPSYIKRILRKPGTNETGLDWIWSLALLYTVNVLTFSDQGFLDNDNNMEENVIFSAVDFVVGYFFWFYLIFFFQALLVINYKGSALYQNKVIQLENFMKSERAPPSVISKSLSHFNYWYKRTNGLNIQNLMSERMGNIFKQDLNYYFYKRTFAILDSILKGGEFFQRNLSNIIKEVFFLPDQDILREMDLVSLVNIVHRGSVKISKNGKRIAILTKGAIFGQLEGSTVRPVRITATAIEHTDILQISLRDFHEVVTAEILENMKANSEFANDHLLTKTRVIENPYNTVEYILRGDKVIKLPRMRNYISINSNMWYFYWLYFVYLWLTAATLTLSVVAPELPENNKLPVLLSLSILDFLYLLNFIAELYTMELMVVENECVYKYNAVGKLTQWRFYCDLVSLSLPIIALFTNLWYLHLIRFLRIHMFHDFSIHFCNNLKNKYAPFILKFIGLFLIIHAISCGYVFIACRSIEDHRLLTVGPFFDNMTIMYNITVYDTSEWLLPERRADHQGCVRITYSYNRDNITDPFLMPLVPQNWRGDFLVAYLYVINLLFTTGFIKIPFYTRYHVYYNVIVQIILVALEAYLASFVLSVIFSKHVEIRRFDYNTKMLLTFFKNTRLSTNLYDDVRKHLRVLGRQYQEQCLPKIVHYSPLCIKEDIYSALYMHHLMTPNVFNQIPYYFLRQLATRFERGTYFPGKYIVREGDIFGNLYFIHEGEVERWYTDSNGDSRLVSVMTQNAYFGLSSGILPRTPYKFSYVTRTVVVVAILSRDSWMDLLEGYPEIKEKIIYNLRHSKREITIGAQRSRKL